MVFNQFNKYILFFLIALLIIPDCKAENEEQRIKVILRSVGHEFLIQMGDSTSRVLPIKKEGSRYKIEFENEFDFIPEMLSIAAFKIINETNTIENYIVEVENCEEKEVVYSYEISLEKDDSIIPCKSRELPKGCYLVYFTILQSEELIQPKESFVNLSFRSVYILLLLGFIFGLVVYLIKKARAKKSNPYLISIGQYQFDKKSMILTLKANSIELSSKEADLLLLLFSNENKTLEREYILNIVWGDEGGYVGRTLDVFISKLRKKIEADPNLKIINIRGVGYRFVIK